MSLQLNGTDGVTFNDGSEQWAAASPIGTKNRIINGAMVIDQRNAGAATANTISGYTLDRWAVSQSTAGKLIVQQNAGSVTPPTGFSNYLGITSQSAYSVGVNDYYMVYQMIEGFNVADLEFGTANAKTITASFWVRSSLTGTFGGSLQNSVPNRSYPFTYTISSANTWEQKTITIAGDTTGTWEKTTSIGIRIQFALGVGSTYSGTAGAWNGNNNISVTGATSVVGTNGATFYITGVQLEVGDTATPFEVMPYDMQLARCQRYYEKSYNISTSPGTLTDNVVGGVGEAVSTTKIASSVHYKVSKRISGNTVTIYAYDGTSGTVTLHDSAGNSGATGAVPNKIGEFGYEGIKKTGGTNFTVGNYYWWQWTSSAEL